MRRNKSAGVREKPKNRGGGVSSRPGHAPGDPLLGKGFAGQPDDGDRANDPARVFEIDLSVGHWIALGQFAQQVGQGRGIEFGTQRRIGRRHLA